MGIVFRWLIYSIIYLVVVGTVFWGIVSFCGGNPAIMEWSVPGRITLFMLSAICTVGLLIFTALTEEEQRGRSRVTMDDGIL